MTSDELIQEIKAITAVGPFKDREAEAARAVLLCLKGALLTGRAMALLEHTVSFSKAEYGRLQVGRN